MDVRSELDAVMENPERSRRHLFRALTSAPLYVRGPEVHAWALARPDTGQRAVPAFLTAEEGARFWAGMRQGEPALIEISLPDLARQAEPVGGVVLEPGEGGLLIDRAELRQLALGQIPGEFAAWLRDLGRLGTLPSEIMDQLRRAHVHVITGPDETGGHRLYLLSKSADDGARALPCFSAAETLAQFAEVRRLFGSNQRYGVALKSGAECIRIAVEIVASIIVDPESAWETTLEPTLLDLGREH